MTFGGQLIHRWWVRWLLGALLWSIVGLLFAMPMLSDHNWQHPLLGSLAQWWSWGLVTPLIFWVDARLPFKEKQLGMRILAQLVPSLVFTTLYIYVFAALRAVVGLADGAHSPIRACSPVPFTEACSGAGSSTGLSSEHTRLIAITITTWPASCAWNGWSAASPRRA